MKPEIKYIYWYLISPYDGYATEENLTWDEALAMVKVEISNHFHPGSQENKLKQFLSQGRLTLTGNPDSTNFCEVFITSQKLTGPIE